MFWTTNYQNVPMCSEGEYSDDSVTAPWNEKDSNIINKNASANFPNTHELGLSINGTQCDTTASCGIEDIQIDPSYHSVEESTQCDSVSKKNHQVSTVCISK